MNQTIESGTTVCSPLAVNSLVNVREWCPLCGAMVNTVTVDEAMTILLRADTFCRLAATTALHCVEMPRGRLLVCLNSWPRQQRRPKKSQAARLH